MIQILTCNLSNLANVAKVALTRATDLEIVLNGHIVVAPQNFNIKTSQLILSVALQTNNEIKVKIRGLPTAYVTIQIDRTTSSNQAPLANFTVTPGPATDPLNYSFDGRTSSDPDGTLTSYLFDFGDGNQAQTSAANHRFDSIGTYNVTLTVTDNKGAQNSKVAQVNVQDTRPPILTINSPSEGANLNSTSVQISGSADEPLREVTARGEMLVLGADLKSFSGTVTLSPGANTIPFVATDLAGNSTTVNRHVTLSINRPPLASFTIKTKGGIAPLLATFDASQSTDPDGHSLTYAWDFGDGGTDVGAFVSHIFNSTGTFDVKLKVTDSAGESAIRTSQVVVTQANLPPDPTTIAPTISFKGVSLVSESLNFLITGTNPVQTGVLTGALDTRRQTLLRGRVLAANGQPLSAVQVSAIGQPQLGKTLTRTDGYFDLVINGGGAIHLEFLRNGYLPVHRRIESLWRDMNHITNVVMTPLDSKVTRIKLSSMSLQAVEGSVVTDERGPRKALVLSPAGNSASMILPGGGSVSTDNLSIRITEYTVGDNGRKAMLADLPPHSAYTYAIEMSADEAIAAGAVRIDFEKPLVYYVENFVGLAPGSAVPSGYYDRESVSWKAEEDGIIVKILSVQNGSATISFDGTSAATAQRISEFGITNAELAMLGSKYTAGQELWRIPIAHFSGWDFNYPFSLPPDATDPNGGPVLASNDLPDPNGPNLCQGSIIEVENQVLGESLAITGTPFRLMYRSDRVKGTPLANSIDIELAGDISSMPSLRSVLLNVTAAGNQFSQEFTNPTSYQKTTYSWDGRDAYGRTFFGARNAQVSIDFRYQGEYVGGAYDKIVRSFGQLSSGTGVSKAPIYGLIDVNRRYNVSLESKDSRVFGLGGWGIDAYHFYSPISQKVYRGDGRSTSLQQNNQVVETVIGDATWDGNGPITGADGTPASGAYINNPRRVRVAPNGDIYLVDTFNYRVMRIDRNGLIYRVFGGGTEPFSEGLPATSFNILSALNPELNDIAFSPSGELYYAQGSRIIKVDSAGIMHLVGGDGNLPSTVPAPGDGGLARDAKFHTIWEIKFGPDGSLYVMDGGDQRIRQIRPDGYIVAFAGGGEGGDGSRAQDARIAFPMSFAMSSDGMAYVAGSDLKVLRIRPDGIVETYLQGFFQDRNEITTPREIIAAPDGSLYILTHPDSNSLPNIILKVDPDKTITRIAGTDSGGFNGDGRLPTETQFLAPNGMALHPDGSLLIADTQNSRLRRIRSVLPAFSGGLTTIPSQDGSEYYFFSALGLHLETRDTLTGAIKYKFEHDSHSLLTKIHDRTGNVTEIVRDGSGMATEIISPFGHHTRFTSDANGYLQSVTNPMNEKYQMSYDGDTGLLLEFKDARQNSTTFNYDERGRLRRETRPNQGFLELLRADLQRPRKGYEVSRSTSQGYTARHLVENDATGNKMVQTWEDGGSGRFTALEGKHERKRRDQSIWNAHQAPDPIFGLQSSYYSAEATKLPSGLTQEVSRNRSAQFSSSSGLPVIESLSQATMINGKTYSAQYSGSNRLLRLSTPEGRLSQIQLDSIGRVSAYQIGGLEPVSLSFNAKGLLSQSQQGARRVQITYNAQGLIEETTNALNQKNQFSYDQAGRIESQQLPDGRSIGFSYDANGNLTGITPPGRPMHQFLLNAMNLVSSYLPPSLGATPINTIYSYNSDSQLTRVQRPDGQDVLLNYDSARAQLRSIQTSLGANSFNYSSVTGQLTSLSSYDGQNVALQYDGPFSRSESWSGVVAGFVTRDLNADFNVVKEDISGNIIAFTFDNDRLLKSAGQEQITRHATTAQVIATQLGGVNEAFTYNNFGELLTYSAPGFSSQLVRDNLGRVIQKTETVLSSTNVFEYGYDDTGRLTTVRQNGSNTSTYGYDSNSNRLSRNNTLATYDSQDRLLNYGGLTFTYTNNGEIRTKTDSGDVTTFDYDVFGNLKRVTLPNGRAISYVVDALNRRVAKKVNGTLVQGFLYKDGLRPIAELNSQGQISSVYVYGVRSNVPDYIVKQGVIYKIISDHLGSPRLIIRASDLQVMQRLEYNEFGMVVSDSNPGFQPFGFAGGLYDSDTELVRFGARDYDPETGRWTSKDPILFNGGDTNLYGYTFNDPINLIDPTGLTWEYNNGTGQLTHIDNNTGVRTPAGTGYSGTGQGRNNPDMSPVSNVGPIPTGSYTIRPPINSPQTGPNALPLNPNSGTNTFGRSGFQIHGNNPSNDASHGCIILPPGVRNQIINSGDNDLNVVN
ncbi:MAG: PKD domain-containing protein [Bdellovibrionales bacterium]|nr:PKD domain-containing protein [Bdellovibrionales bacterium]